MCNYKGDKMKTSIYKWSGEYWGFIYNKRLFDQDSNYKGWIDESNQVWDENGRYMGELVQNNYILRRTSKVEPVPKVPKVPPVPPVPPVPKIDKIGKIPKVGWIDPLDN